MDDPPDAGSLSRVDQFASVLHGARLGVFFLIEPHPVGIDQHFHTLQAAGHTGFIEIQREGPDLAPEGIGAVRMSGQGNDFLTPLQQAAGDVFS